MLGLRRSTRQFASTAHLCNKDVRKFDPMFPSNYVLVPEREVEPIIVMRSKRWDTSNVDWFDIAKAKWMEYKLNTWPRFVPMLIAGGSFCYINGYIAVNPHNFGVAFVWGLSYVIFQNMKGDTIKTLEEDDAEDRALIRRGEANRIATIRNVISFLDSIIKLPQEVAAGYKKVDDALVRLNKGLSIQVLTQHHTLMNQKLQAIAGLEQGLVIRLKDQLVEDVIAKSIAAISIDKKFKENALNQALAILSNHEAKRGKDIVGEFVVSKLQAVKNETTNETVEGSPLVREFRANVAKIMKDDRLSAPAPVALA